IECRARTPPAPRVHLARAGWHGCDDVPGQPILLSASDLSMRILVAEDDAGLREVLVLGLEDQAYQVDAVERGDDAIDQLQFYEYDVAIVDWRMPGAPGIDVVAWARRNNR